MQMRFAYLLGASLLNMYYMGVPVKYVLQKLGYRSAVLSRLYKIRPSSPAGVFPKF